METILMITFISTLLAILAVFATIILTDQILDYIDYCKHRRDMQREYEKYIRDHNQTENISKQ